MGWGRAVRRAALRADLRDARRAALRAARRAARRTVRRAIHRAALRVALGLGAAMQHYLLRFWLFYAHAFPWKAVPFLDDATTRILLRRVGGGYSFIHRLLLEYFADLDT